MTNDQTRQPTQPTVAVFGTKPYDRDALSAANDGRVDLRFLDKHLDPHNAALAEGCQAVCAFVNDDLGPETIGRLAKLDIDVIAMRCAGVNNVDLDAAKSHNIAVVNVPSYSPEAVAEHCLGLMLSLNRGIHRAHNRVREQNFSLTGLLGFNLHGKTIGIIGTGQIGTALARISRGFGMRILAHDPNQSSECVELGARYVALDVLLADSDIISLHCPLVPETHHLIGTEEVQAMRDGVMLINTSRGALVDSSALIAGLKSGKIGYLGLDVYEEEQSLFFRDLSSSVITDDVFSRLLTFPNVLITGHQAFFTADALGQIAETTIDNIATHFKQSESSIEP